MQFSSSIPSTQSNMLSQRLDFGIHAPSPQRMSPSWHVAAGVPIHIIQFSIVLSYRVKVIFFKCSNWRKVFSLFKLIFIVKARVILKADLNLHNYTEPLQYMSIYLDKF